MSVGHSAVMSKPAAVAATVKYLSTTGAANSYANTPDTAGISVTTDIEMVMRLGCTDWTPAANKALMSKLNTANQGGYEFGITTAGLLRIITDNGTAQTTTTASTATGFTDGTVHWIKVTLDLDDGAGNHVGTFYTAADSDTEPVSWTQLGTTQTVAGVLTIADGTRLLYIAARSDGSSALSSQQCYQAIVRSGIGGTTVISLDPSNWTTGTTWVAATGQTWTMAASASIVTV